MTAVVPLAGHGGTPVGIGYLPVLVAYSGDPERLIRSIVNT